METQRAPIDNEQSNMIERNPSPAGRNRGQTDQPTCKESFVISTPTMQSAFSYSPSELNITGTSLDEAKEPTTPKQAIHNQNIKCLEAPENSTLDLLEKDPHLTLSDESDLHLCGLPEVTTGTGNSEFGSSKPDLHAVEDASNASFHSEQGTAEFSEDAEDHLGTRQPRSDGRLEQSSPRSLAQIKETFFDLCDDVLTELAVLDSSKTESFRQRFTAFALSLPFLATNANKVNEVSSPHEQSGDSPYNNLGNKIDDLLHRLKEATNLPEEAITASESESKNSLGIENALNKDELWWEENYQRLSQRDRVAQGAFTNPRRSLSSSCKQMPSITNHYNIDNETSLLIDEARVKRKWLDAIQRGCWFFRVARKFGPLGKAIKSIYRKRVFVWLTRDFRRIGLSNSEPSEPQGDQTKTPKITFISLDEIEGFAYGVHSRAFRLLEETRSDLQHPAHLCLSINTSKAVLDIIALNDLDVERWVLGLNSLIPFFPGRQFFTPAEFAEKKSILRNTFYNNLETKKHKVKKRGHRENNQTLDMQAISSQ